jgi:hypothetical protein
MEYCNPNTEISTKNSKFFLQFFNEQLSTKISLCVLFRTFQIITITFFGNSRFFQSTIRMATFRYVTTASFQIPFYSRAMTMFTTLYNFCS